MKNYIIGIIVFFCVSVYAQEDITKQKQKTKESSALMISTYAQSNEVMNSIVDTSKNKKKKTNSYLSIGADPQDLYRTLQPGELLVKYVGKKPLAVVTNSGSGKKYEGLIRSGFGAFVKEKDYEENVIKNFVIFNCGNDTELKGAKAKTLGLPKDSLLVICSYEQIHDAQFDSEILTEIFQKVFGPEGEWENLSDQMFLVSEKVKEVDEKLSKIEKLLGTNTASGLPLNSQKEISSAPFPWKTIGTIAAIGVVGTIIYFIIKNNTKSTSYDGEGEPNTGPNGPPNPPLTKVGFSFKF